MNLMTDDKQYEANELFATLDATTKKIYLKDQFQVTLTDTVGFIQDLPTELVAAFKSTLEESRNVDLLCMSSMLVIRITKNMKTWF